jgi:hypothetical protein
MIEQGIAQNVIKMKSSEMARGNATAGLANGGLTLFTNTSVSEGSILPCMP